MKNISISNKIKLILLTKLQELTIRSASLCNDEKVGDLLENLFDYISSLHFKVNFGITVEDARDIAIRFRDKKFINRTLLPFFRRQSKICVRNGNGVYGVKGVGIETYAAVLMAMFILKEKQGKAIDLLMEMLNKKNEAK